MLIVSLAFLTVGYTLLYSGLKGGCNDEFVKAPWTLWSKAFDQLGIEAKSQQAAVSRYLQYVSSQQQQAAAAGNFFFGGVR